MRNPDTEELKTLKGLIRFAKREKINAFEYNGFKFDLSEFDQAKKQMKKIETQLEQITDRMNRVEMKVSFKK